MNPIYQVIIDTFLHLRRRCPGCGMDQLVAPGKKDSVVQCKFCGDPIPPHGDADR
ncbi:MAG: 30S ribosomal protein S27 [Deltaproteobacteria bacterium]|nr:30S ribosomal protein S27 [Candidatus Zymogenaceae bacterium]